MESHRHSLDGSECIWKNEQNAGDLGLVSYGIFWTCFCSKPVVLSVWLESPKAFQKQIAGPHTGESEELFQVITTFKSVDLE